MDCEPFRDALSARLDGEDPGVATAALDEHLAGCPACSAFEARAGALHRTVRVRAAEAVPDLTPAILGAARVGRRPVVPDWARYGLLVVALTELVLSLPELVASGAHAGRDLAAFEVALCVALLAVARRPGRAPGLLPMGAALVLAVVVSAATDIGQGDVPALSEAHHVLLLVGLALLWVVARAVRPGETTVRAALA